MDIKQDYDAVATINLSVGIEKVWNALTKPELIKKYFHNTNVVTDWKVGSPIIWKGEWQGKSYEDKGVVLEYKPYILLKTTHWSPLSGTPDEPENYHAVTYELKEVGDGTKLVLTQSNNSSQEAAEKMAENGWMPVLQALKTLLEK